ncbi:MAG TPA: pyridoxal-phosphate dependent enzyme [Vicinamibacterales bacterium]|nr:pyridoxal-phosphate dependent enzyme [Vicinamibacterales bacterium]
MNVVDILAARRRIDPFVQPSPLRQSLWLSDSAGGAVYLKLESVQLTNSFKIRGALNAALRVIEQAGGCADAAPTIVAASAGNHGRGLAFACERLGLKGVIFTPRGAPETKKTAIRRHGVELRDDAADYDAAEEAARAFADARGYLYVTGYNHVDVIAGAGTVALEILDVLPRLDAVVVPIGGGGLASGIGMVMKAVAPDVRVIGVEAAVSTAFAVSLREGQISRIEPARSLADGLTGNLEPHAITFELVRAVVDELAAIDEDEIADAIRQLAGEEHMIAEGAGAVATAAVLHRKVVRPRETAVVMVTGGNIDAGTFARVIAPGPL